MLKIIDSFLFFQELDLLEIRLEYLNPHIDFFVILEASQTFSGKRKEFMFEANSSRYAKFMHKIIYHKVEDFHKNYESLKLHLIESQTPIHTKILETIEHSNINPKTDFHWILEIYHRECIQFALNKTANKNDIVLLSDLDEIPNIEIFSDVNLSRIKNHPFV